MMNQLKLSPLLSIFVVGLTLTCLTACDKEVETSGIRISQCDPEQGGTIAQCAALSNDTLTFALLNKSLGECTGEVSRPTDGHPEYRLKAGGRFYPSAGEYEDQFTLTSDIRARLREGICDL